MQKLTSAPHHGSLEGFWSTRQDLLWAPAPRDTSSRPLSRLTTTRDTATSQVHDLDLTLDSPAGNTWTRLIFPSGTQILSANIDGESTASSNVLSGVDPSRIDLHNYGGGSVRIALRVSTASCDLTVSDHLTGLPGGVTPRPDDRMAWYGSDYTIVSRQAHFCRP